MRNKLEYMRKILICLFILFGLIGLCDAANVNVKVVFPFTVENVHLEIWEPYYNNIILTESGHNEFSCNLKDLKEHMLFYIYYFLPQNKDTLYIASGNKYEGDKIPNRFDAYGLKYGKIYLNNQLLDNSFTVANFPGNSVTGLNISAQIISDSCFIPYYGESRHVNIDDRIPSEVAHRYKYLDKGLIYNSGTSITGWAIAINDNNIIDTSKIEVKYIRLYVFKNNVSTLLDNKEYKGNKGFSSQNDGGLYYRFPFFPEGDSHIDMPGTTNDSVLTFSPSSMPNKVWHWWTDRKESNGFDYDAYKVECKFRMKGHALVQVGIDFKVNDSIKELGVSDWYFEKNGEWQNAVFDTRTFNNSLTEVKNIEILKPDFNLYMNKKSNRINVDYNYISKGDYILSLYDTSGKLIYTRSFHTNISNDSFSFNISNKYPDLMIYKLTNENHILFKGKIKNFF